MTRRTLQFREFKLIMGDEQKQNDNHQLDHLHTKEVDSNNQQIGLENTLQNFQLTKIRAKKPIQSKFNQTSTGLFMEEQISIS